MMDWTTVLVAVLGIIGAYITHRLERRRHQAETERLKGETERLEAEAEKLRAEAEASTLKTGAEASETITQAANDLVALMEKVNAKQVNEFQDQVAELLIQIDELRQEREARDALIAGLQVQLDEYQDYSGKIAVIEAQNGLYAAQLATLTEANEQYAGQIDELSRLLGVFITLFQEQNQRLEALGAAPVPLPEDIRQMIED